MSEHELLKKACLSTLAEELMLARGDRSQEKMAEVCGMTLRNYSNLERRCSVTTSMSMVNIYAAGVDLNKWAEKTLKRYEKLLEKEGLMR